MYAGTESCAIYCMAIHTRYTSTGIIGNWRKPWDPNRLDPTSTPFRSKDFEKSPAQDQKWFWLHMLAPLHHLNSQGLRVKEGPKLKGQGATTIMFWQYARVASLFLLFCGIAAQKGMFEWCFQHNRSSTVIIVVSMKFTTKIPSNVMTIRDNHMFHLIFFARKSDSGAFCALHMLPSHSSWQPSWGLTSKWTLRVYVRFSSNHTTTLFELL